MLWFQVVKYFRVWKPFLFYTMMKLNWRERLIHYHPRIKNMLTVKAHCGRGRPHFSTIFLFLSFSKNNAYCPWVFWRQIISSLTLNTFNLDPKAGKYSTKNSNTNGISITVIEPHFYRILKWDFYSFLCWGVHSKRKNAFLAVWTLQLK